MQGELRRSLSSQMSPAARADPLHALQLRPYVARTAKIDPKDAEWPVALNKPLNPDGKPSKRGGIYGPRGFDGEYYIQLSEYLADKAKALKA